MSVAPGASRHEISAAARALARAGLVDAFGHVSVRDGPGHLLITPAVPLSTVTPRTALVEVPLDAAVLPDAAPREAWLHLALARARAETGAVCRAQPRHVAALAALDRTPLPLNGHAAMLGAAALHRDSRLIRSAAAAEAVVACVVEAAGRRLDGGTAPVEAIVLRGNGALTTGATLADAVARMWLLERAAELTLRALGAGTPEPLPKDEQDWWRGRAGELLPRVYAYLIGPDGREGP